MANNTETWSPVRLGELIEVKHGFAFEGKHFRDLPTSSLLLTPGNFAVGGGFQIQDGREKYYEGPIEPEYVLKSGDLLVTMTDLSKEADTLGYPAFVPDVPGLAFLHNQRIGKVTFRSGVNVERRFLFYVLCSADYRSEVLASATGTTVKHTAPSRIEAFRFSLPPKRVRQDIASLLGALDDKIELNNRMNRTLQELASALFKSWVVDFDPVQANLEGRQPIGVPSGTASLFPKSFEDLELGPIPRGWKVRPLDTIADFLNGLALQKFPPKDSLDLPVIKIAQLRAGRPTGVERASADLPPQYVIEDGDVIFSWSGSLMVDVWCGGRGALNQHLFKVTSKEYPKWFFLGWVNEHLSEFQRIASDKATTMGHIRRHHLTEAMVVVPDSPLLTALSRLQEPLLTALVVNRVENRTLRALRDMLLPGLISGEITISNAKKTIAEVA